MGLGRGMNGVDMIYGQQEGGIMKVYDTWSSSEDYPSDDNKQDVKLLGSSVTDTQTIV